MGYRKFAKMLIEQEGACIGWGNCDKCPIQTPCSESGHIDSDAETVAKAKKWLEDHPKKKLKKHPIQWFMREMVKAKGDCLQFMGVDNGLCEGNKTYGPCPFNIVCGGMQAAIGDEVRLKIAETWVKYKDHD